MTEQEQSFAHHSRVIPGFHYVTFGLMATYTIWLVVKLIRALSAGAFPWVLVDISIQLLFAVAVLLLFFYARVFALTVQDRVIRNEERERLARLLPADWRARIVEFTPAQLVALRFASDAELPALAQKVLQENIQERSAIKALIKNWRPDHLRA